MMEMVWKMRWSRIYTGGGGMEGRRGGDGTRRGEGGGELRRGGGERREEKMLLRHTSSSHDVGDITNGGNLIGRNVSADKSVAPVEVTICIFQSRMCSMCIMGLWICWEKFETNENIKYSLPKCRPWCNIATKMCFDDYVGRGRGQTNSCKILAWSSCWVMARWYGWVVGWLGGRWGGCMGIVFCVRWWTLGGVKQMVGSIQTGIVPLWPS